jgi:hypothetical protein
VGLQQQGLKSQEMRLDFVLEQPQAERWDFVLEAKWEFLSQGMRSGFVLEPKWELASYLGRFFRENVATRMRVSSS